MEETQKGSEEAYKRLNAILSETCKKIEKVRIVSRATRLLLRRRVAQHDSRASPARRTTPNIAHESREKVREP